MRTELSRRDQALFALTISWYTRFIVTHPASTTHSKLTRAERDAVGISDCLVRISVALEHVNDVIADVEQALAQSTRG